MAVEGRVGRLLLGSVGLILTAALIAWFLDNFERRSVEVDEGYSAAARRNPLLAAERFLTRLDVEARAVAGRNLVRDLPPTRDLLLIGGLSVLNVQRQDELHRWLSAGGHLIIEATTLWSAHEDRDDHPGDFLARYGVFLRELDPAPASDRVRGEVHMDGIARPLQVEFRSRFYLEEAQDAAKATVRVEGQPRLLQLDVGDGMLTVASDLEWMSNAHIGEGDHALFLALLTHPGPDGKVWLLYDTQMPWLGALLWQKAPQGMISALCLVLCLLWALGGRLGPLLLAPEKGRRDLLLHLQAGAHFLWRHGRGSRLTEVTRKRVEQAWLRRHPILRSLGKSERMAWIAERSGLTSAEVQRALYPLSVDEQNLVADSASLQRLWTALFARC